MSFALAGPDRLLARYQRTGDPRALGRLFDRTAPELLRVAGWLCGNRADAEDVLQRTFVTVIETRGAFDATKRALPWLCGIVGNHAKKVHEQRQRRGPIVGERAGERDPAHAAEDAEFAATVARLRCELGSPYAEVLDLHLGEGLNAKEIAARLDRPAGTVRTQLVRALALMRRQLPAGFAAGLALSATATASSLATVRAAVVPGAAAAATTFTFGGLLMGKKMAVVVPALALLLGSGTWALVDSNDAVPVRVDALQPAVAAVPQAPRTARDAAEDATATTQRAPFAAPDEVAPDAVTAVLVVRATWKDDGSPAANVGVRVVPTQPSVVVDEREGLTGADGRLVLRGIRPGPCIASTAFSDERPLTVVPASVTTLDVAMHRDGVVHGVVVDVDDRPVAGARLWLSDTGDFTRGFEVGSSDMNGRFEVQARLQQHVGARKAGYAPSRLRLLSRIDAPLLVRLPSLGGAVRGRVLDDAGEPLANALVQVGERGADIVAGSTLEEMYVQSAPMRLRTDARGAFLADGIGSGSTTVHAWAAGHGFAVQPVLVETGRTSDVLLTLPRAAVVEGTVRDEQRRAVAGALIAARDSGCFGSVHVHSDADGRFRLDHVSPGNVELLAERDAAYALVTLHLEPGRVATWEPVLGTRRLAGTLVGPAGTPIAGYEIGTFADKAPVESAVTDAAGRFVLAGMRGSTVDLVVSVRGMGIAQRNDVPLETDVVIRLTDAEQPSGTIRGRIVDERGNGLPRAVSVMNAATSFATRVEAKLDGTFVCDALPPGTWWLSIDGGTLGSVELPPIAIAPHENRVLDAVVLAPAGRIELKLRGIDKAPGLVRFAPDDGTSARYLSPDGMNVAGELTRGGYTALAEIDGMAGAVSFVLNAGKTTRAELVFAPATAVDVEYRGVERRPGDTLRTVARDAAGNIVATESIDFRGQPPDGPIRRRLRVPPGPCVLETRHSDGRSATTSFRADPAIAGRAEQRIVVELPAR